MKGFSDYLVELLRVHDCVIVPGFGGFVAKYQGAQIHPTQHIFNPPGKRVAFNKSLSNNDGLLAHHISSRQSISYHEAMEMIDRMVWQMNHELSQNGKLEMNGLGVFKTDVEKNLQFFPSVADNLLSESFGLSGFQFQPVMRGVSAYEFKETYKDRPGIKPVRSKKRVQFVKWAVPLLAIPVFALWMFKSGTGRQKYEQLSSVWTSETEETVYKPNNHSIQFSTYEVPEIKVEAPKPEARENKIENVVQEEKGANVTSENSLESTNSGKYLVITGCFSVPENAEKHISELKLKNFNGFMAGSSKNGLTRVACGGFDNEAGANTFSARLKSAGIENWVLKPGNN